MQQGKDPKKRFLKISIIPALIIFLLLAAGALGADGRESAKYIFLFIGDGMGEAQVRTAELYRIGSGAGEPALSTFPVRGSISTHSADAAVTDSAAAGTAMASGYKTNNGVLGMDPSRTKNLTSIAETARDRGMKVGIVTSSFLNDATPAAFYAHRPSRIDYYEIGEQLIDSGFDYFAGGGHLPEQRAQGKSQGSLRTRRKKGDTGCSAPGPGYLPRPARGKKIIAAVCARGHLPYEMDRTAGSPSLAELTKLGIGLLDNPDGFFLIVEGGKMDWACHLNDAAAMVHDMVAFDAAAREALSFAQRHPKETLLVVLADHETGGMSIEEGITAAQLFPVLSAQKESSESFTVKVDRFRKGQQRTFEGMLPLITDSFGLHSLSESELVELRTAFAQSMLPKEQRKRDREYLRRYGPYEPLSVTATRILNRKAGITWSSFGHSGADVPVFAHGAGSAIFAGEYDNTDIARKLMSLLHFP
ncbi:alkaline phosphatase [Aminivibrio sp.]|uniref:alkaline phosphatase n=1 Tax=Aminivibrio sp. TaxID=1872489 RepID=UPI003D9A0076